MIKTTVAEYASKNQISRTQSSKYLNSVVKKKQTVREMKKGFNSFSGSKHPRTVVYYYIDEVDF